MKKKFVGLFALMAIGLLLTGSLALAYGPRMYGENDDVWDAIENDDFESWRSLHEERFTQDRFEEAQSRHEQRESMREAIESNDYDAYSEAVLAIYPESTLISQEDFATLVELHQARLDGDMDTWSELRKEIDFMPGEMTRQGRGNSMGRGLGKGMGQGQGMNRGSHQGGCALE